MEPLGKNPVSTQTIPPTHSRFPLHTVQDPKRSPSEGLRFDDVQIEAAHEFFSIH